MVFVGVFLGFLSDNFRQHLSERKIEKRNMQSFIGNLQFDINNLSISIDSCTVWKDLMDELVSLEGQFSDVSFMNDFFNYAVRLKSTDGYVSNESTFQQMQSTNTLRLISIPEVIDSILSYQTSNSILLQQQKFVERNFFARTEVLLDITDLRDIPFLKFNGNEKSAQLYLNYLFVETVAMETYIEMLKFQRDRASNIIEFIQKEYKFDADK